MANRTRLRLARGAPSRTRPRVDYYPAYGWTAPIGEGWQPSLYLRDVLPSHRECGHCGRRIAIEAHCPECETHAGWHLARPFDMFRTPSRGPITDGGMTP